MKNTVSAMENTNNAALKDFILITMYVRKIYLNVKLWLYDVASTSLRNNEERSISPLVPLKVKRIYFLLRLFGLPFEFKNEDATEFNIKTGIIFKPVNAIE